MLTYWLNVFTPTTWQEAVAHGLRVTGFGVARRVLVSRIREGDILICYVAGESKLVGALRATGRSYHATTPRIWHAAEYPERVPVIPLMILGDHSAVDFREVLPTLTFFDAGNPRRTWSRLQGSPNRLDPRDGEKLLAAVYLAGTINSEPGFFVRPAKRGSNEFEKSGESPFPEFVTAASSEPRISFISHRHPDVAPPPRGQRRYVQTLLLSNEELNRVTAAAGTVLREIDDRLRTGLRGVSDEQALQWAVLKATLGDSDGALKLLANRDAIPKGAWREVLALTVRSGS